VGDGKDWDYAASCHLSGGVTERMGVSAVPSSKEERGPNIGENWKKPEGLWEAWEELRPSNLASRKKNRDSPKSLYLPGHKGYMSDKMSLSGSEQYLRNRGDLQCRPEVDHPHRVTKGRKNIREGRYLPVEAMTMT